VKGLMGGGNIRQSERSRCSVGFGGGVIGIVLGLALFVTSQASGAANSVNFVHSISGTNFSFRLDLGPDWSNYFTLDEGTNLTQSTTRLTSLGGGSNAWNFVVLDPSGGIDPALSAYGGGTNKWNFSTSAKYPQIFWKVRQLPTSPGGYFQFSYTLAGINLNVHFHLSPALTNYYILDIGTNLTQFSPVLMCYGGGSNVWAQTALTTQNHPSFWRVRRVPTNDPLDTDGDGLDDLFELNHGLNPLDSADANSNSGLVDGNNNPLTWLEAYHYYFVNNIKIYDAVSREVSSFNFGQATASYEAVSREVSSFNTLQPDTNQNGIDDGYEASHGITNANQLSGFTSDFPNNTGTPLTWLQLYRSNFGGNRTLYDAVSRETSAFNFGQGTANYEAISREVSAFNTPLPDTNQNGIDDGYEVNHGITNANQASGFTSDFPNNSGAPLTWLQVYRANFGQNRALYDAVSRETSAFNFGQATANYEAISREVSAFNFGQGTANYEAISREVSVFNQP
jgi:hypothetical protein